MKKFKTHFNEGIVSSVAAFTFIKKLTTPFEKWDEFKNGIIDKDGKIIEKNKKMPIFNGIARKIKILFHKFVPNKKYLAILLAMYLLKKEDINPVENIIKEELDKQLSTEEKVILINILNEVTTANTGTGDYSDNFFIGKNLSDEEARKLGMRRMRKMKRLNRNQGGFGYNARTGFCRFA